MTILRTSLKGCWELKSNGFGQYLAPTIDPLADTVITPEQLEGFELNSDIPKIPHALWSRWIDLCIEMCKRGTGDLEVSCRILRKDSDYRICIPVQKVDGASVRVDSFDKAIDITTGEVIEQWPPEGWTPCGSSHSHNTMDAFFSSTDDKYELGDPGMHIVVGRIDVNKPEYTPKASVVANNRRFDVEAEDLICLEETEADAYTTSYHPSVLDIITLPRQFSRSALPPLPNSSLLNNQFSSYSRSIATYDNSLVSNEMAAAISAVRSLRDAATRNGFAVGSVIEDLQQEIDSLIDEAYFGNMYSDPHYYSAY